MRRGVWAALTSVWVQCTHKSPTLVWLRWFRACPARARLSRSLWQPSWVGFVVAAALCGKGHYSKACRKEIVMEYRQGAVEVQVFLTRVLWCIGVILDAYPIGCPMRCGAV